MFRFSRVQLACAVAGVVAIVFAANMPRALGGGTAFQYVSQTSVQVPGMASLGTGNMSSTQTTTISSQRTRHDDGKGNSVIVQCDFKRIVNIDNNAKTYSVIDFDNMTNEMQAALKHAQTNAPTVNGHGDVTFKIDEKPDIQTQTILGMTAHHAVDTLTMTSTGTGDCPNSKMSMGMDVWYAPSPITMECPMKMPSLSPASGGGGSPCMQGLMVQASSMRGSQSRIPLKTTMTIPAGPMVVTSTEQVTSAKTIPYDPSYFGIPAGYTKVDLGATPAPH